MEVRIDKSFEKDVKTINDDQLKRKIANVIIHMRNSNDVSYIGNLKKIKTSSNHFRIRIGDYRLGIRISGKVVEFIRCLHRKEIYRYFPE